MRAEEFYEWANEPGNDARLFELHRGRVVEMPLGSELHGVVCASIIGVVGGHVFGKRRAYICSNNAGIVVERNPDTVLAPDLSLFDDGRSFDDMEQGYSLTPPRLVIEVLEAHDTVARMAWRIERFFAFGVEGVWTIDTQTPAVSECRHTASPRFFQGGDERTGEDRLPGFRCHVRDFFMMPWERAPRCPEGGSEIDVV